MSDTCPTVKIKVADGFMIINESDFDPKIHEPLDGTAPRMQGTPEELGGMTDDQLRAAIEAATGTAPHPRTGRKKLLEQFNALNVEETAANGLTRREIEADLAAMEVDFDPADSLEDLAALRDLSREARA